MGCGLLVGHVLVRWWLCGFCILVGLVMVVRAFKIGLCAFVGCGWQW